MKYSIYNTLLELSEQNSLLYNAYSDKYIIFKNRFRQLIESGAFEEVEHSNKVLYDQLVEAGAIIEPSVDEIEMLRERIRTIDNDTSTFMLYVNPTVDCNFRCWYCYEDHVKGSKMAEQTLESLKRLVDTTLDSNKEIKHFFLSFFGGEPLLGYRNAVKPLISYVNQVCELRGVETSISFTSNGYLLTDPMVEFFAQSRVDNFQITLDGTKDDHNKVRFTHTKKGSYDRIIDNVRKLAMAKIHVLLRINYTSENIEQVNTIASEFDTLPSEQRSFIRIDFQRVWQDQKSNDITEVVDSNARSFRERGYRVSNNSIDYVKNSCYADKRQQVLVNYNGDVFKCTARDFISANRDGYLTETGEVVWENNALEERMSARFRNTLCHVCRIAPLCGGGCNQKAKERGSDNICAHDYSPQEMDKVVLDRFEQSFVGS